MTDFGLWVSYLLLFAALAGVVIFPIRSLLMNPGNAKNVLIGLGSLLVLFLISYLLSGGQANEKFQITEGQSKMIGAGLTMFYLLAIFTLLITLYSEVVKIFRR